MRPTAQSLDLRLGKLPSGCWNDITDVAGVLVGHETLSSGEGPLQPGKGPVRTGITVIRPHPGNLFKNKVIAAVHTINGFGKAVGFEQVREFGHLEAPIALTNTLNVGLVLDALVSLAVKENPEIGVSTSTVNILVGETNDGFLNDIQGRHVHAEHVWAAYNSASSGPIQQGSVGAGAGTVCFGWKGGIGSASRVLPPDLGDFTVGALVQTNFGKPGDLTIAGVPVGRLLLSKDPSGLPKDPRSQADQGSVMVILATDAPASADLLERMCRRAAAGLARTGCIFGTQSGDFVVSFSTVNTVDHNPRGLVIDHRQLNNQPRLIDALFQAVVETVEEAVINSLFCAETVRGRDEQIAEALPVAETIRLLERNQKQIEME